MNYYQGILIKDNKDICPNLYSPMQFIKGKYQLFVFIDGRYALATSRNLIDWKYKYLDTTHGTSQEINGKYYCAYYKDYDFHCVYCFSVSENKKDFKDVFTKEEFHGLDISWIYDNGIFKAYARMNITPQIRTIGYMESKDFVNWTLLKEVFAPDELDRVKVNPEGRGKEFYSMSVVRTEKGYFGFLNVYDIPNEIMEVELAYSENGIDKWKRLNDRKPILERQENVKQIYACASVIDNEVHIVTISSDFYHDHRNREGNYFFTEHYKIPLKEIYKYLL